MVRNILFSILLLIIVGCKPTQVAFNETSITKDYVANILHLVKEDTAHKITGGKIFIADLYENFISRDGIAEKTIINQNSTKQRLDLPLIDKTYKLFIITTEGTDSREAIFIPAIFQGMDKCIGLGPALIGKFGPGELAFYKKAKFYSKKKAGHIGWVYDRKSSEFKSGDIFDPFDDSKTKFNVLFQTIDTTDISDLNQFNITNILQLSDNRFGGKKPLVYNIASVFEDPEALNFIFLRKF